MLHTLLSWACGLGGMSLIVAAGRDAVPHISADSAVSLGLVLSVVGFTSWFAHRSGKLSEKLDRTTASISDLKRLVMEQQTSLAACKSDHRRTLEALRDRITHLEAHEESQAKP